MLMMSLSSCTQDDIVVPAPEEETVPENSSNLMTRALSYDYLLASNVSTSQSQTFTAAPGKSYYVGINPNRVVPLHLWVRNDSSYPIYVEQYASGSALHSWTVSSNSNNPLEITWNFNSVTTGIRITNNNSTSVSGIAWTANFWDE
ncbi:MAG: hypothetical protein LBG59_03245 [Candidatus Peribacteria bacterium]|nr:hypothetical protein [Candidatus Peribacteria bacterium]